MPRVLEIDPGAISIDLRGLADGLAGGRHRELVNAMRLPEAGGTALDHLYLSGSEGIERWG